MPSLDINGASGTEYEFAMRQFGSSLPKTGGVYIITRADPPTPAASTHKVLYIGCSRNIAEDLAKHDQSECFSRYEANMIGVLFEDRSEQCARITQDLIAEHNPTCNP